MNRWYGVSLLVLSCSLNAPRDNPLDPNLGGNICGKVLTRNFSGIANVEIAIPQAERSTSTNSSGEFDFYALPVDSMWLYFYHLNYSPESVIIAPQKGVIDSLTICLNGLPYFEKCGVTTHHYERDWPPDPLYICQLSTEANDFDGEIDIESVWVKIPALAYTKRLVYDSSKQLFIHTLLANELPGGNLEALVGKEILFFIADKESAITVSTPHYISRIVYQVPQIIFPGYGLDTLKTDTAFVWHKYDQGFYVHYYGEIVRIVGGGPAGVVDSFNISDQNDTTDYLNISALAPNEYYWTLEVIDSLGNTCRAKECRFIRN